MHYLWQCFQFWDREKRSASLLNPVIAGFGLDLFLKTFFSKERKPSQAAALFLCTRHNYDWRLQRYYRYPDSRIFRDSVRLSSRRFISSRKSGE